MTLTWNSKSFQLRKENSVFWIFTVVYGFAEALNSEIVRLPMQYAVWRVLWICEFFLAFTFIIHQYTILE